MATRLTPEQLRVTGITKRGVDAALKKTVRQPKAIEVSYAGFLTSGQRRVNAVIVEQLAAMQSILDIARRSDGDRFDDLNDDLAAAFASLRSTVDRLATGGVLRIGIVEHGSKTAQFNDEKYNSPTMNLLGIGNASAGVEQRILNGWARENVQLITNMNAEQIGKLETLFLRALRDGSRSAQVQADVAHIVGGSVNRARLIARDQIGKLNGQLDRQKQTEAGLEGYVWRGALDERERPEHVAREGTTFQWDKPPVDGHPGQPVQCRCSPEPDLGPLLGDEFTPAPDKPTAAERERLEVERKRNIKRQAQKRRKRAKRAGAATRTPAVVAPPPLPPPAAPTPSAVVAPPPPPPPVVPPTPVAVPPAPPPVAPSRPLPKVGKGEQSTLEAVAAGLTESTSDKQRKLVKKLVDKGLVKASFRGGAKFRDIELTAKGRDVLGAPQIAPTPRPVAAPAAPLPAGKLSESDFVKSLENPEVNTLGVWKSNAGYDRLRKVQRGQLRGSDADRNHLARLDRMAERAPEFKGRMFRGLDKLDPDLANALATEGAELELDSWTSFTSSSRSVSQFSENVRGKAWVRYSVDVDKTPVFDTRKAINSKQVGSRSGIKENESEVLAPAGAKFRVKSRRAVRERGEIVGYKVQLEEV